MLERLFGALTPTSLLKRSLDALTERQRASVDRIANISTPQGGFSSTLAAKQAAQQRQGALDQEMTNLADTQLRFQASATILQKTYQELRTIIRTNG